MLSSTKNVDFSVLRMAPTAVDLPEEAPPAKKVALDSESQMAEPIKNGDAPNGDSVQPVLRVELLNEDAKMPFKGSAKAAGFDLCSSLDKTIPARGKQVVETGIKIMLPEGCYGRIAPRSGLAVNHSLDVGAGVVDEDYRGEIKVVMFNLSDSDFEVKKGMRIAQLVCERIFYPSIEKVDSVDETKRGEAGFGSTGTK